MYWIVLARFGVVGEAGAEAVAVAPGISTNQRMLLLDRSLARANCSSRHRGFARVLTSATEVNGLSQYAELLEDVRQTKDEAGSAQEPTDEQTPSPPGHGSRRVPPGRCLEALAVLEEAAATDA